MQRRTFSLCLLAGSGLLAAGCGGGGGEDGGIDVGTPPAPPPMPGPDVDPPTRTIAYVARPDSGDVLVTQVLASGALRSMEAAPAEVGTRLVAVHPSGRHAYAVNGDARSISTYERDPVNGLLRLKQSFPIAMFGAPSGLRFDPTNTIAYVFGGSGVELYSVNTDTGVLAREGFLGSSVLGFDVHPAGPFVFAASDRGRLTSHRVEADYRLTEVNFATTGGGGLPTQIAVAPSGSFLYVTLHTGEIAIHRIDQLNGEVGVQTLMGIGLAATCVAIHPSGLFAYVGGSRDAADDENHVGIFTFEIDPETGALDQLGFEETGAGEIVALAISPSGHSIYAATSTGSAVFAYSIHETSGALASPGMAIEVGGQAASMSFFDSTA